MNVLLACEASGVVRDEFIAAGHNAWSCDLKPSERPGPHFQNDIWEILGRIGHWQRGEYWDLLIAHPDCTYLTSSAEWAYKDADYARYPDVGYHMKLKPGTLSGSSRRLARREAVKFAFALRDCGIPKICIENPIGHLSSAWRKADQVIQPYQFGDDASKATGLWLIGLPKLTPTKYIAPRASDRARTYKGIATAMAEQWGKEIL